MLVYSDHIASILTLKNLPRKQERQEKKVKVWNVAKESGLENYKLFSDKYSDNIEKIIEDKSISIQEAMNRINKIENKIKFKAFGKVTINNKKKDIVEEKEAEGKTQEERAKEIFEEQVDIVEKEFQKIKATTNGKVGQIWEIRKKVLGGKKSRTPPTSIVDPTTSKMVANKEEIKEVTLAYCMDTLKNNIPEEAYKEEINEKKGK